MKATAGAVNVPVVLGGADGPPGRRDRRRRRRRDGRAARRRARRSTAAAGPRSTRRPPAARAFQQGELGLDRYGLRDKLPEFGIEYVPYEKWRGRVSGHDRRRRGPLHDAARRHLQRRCTSRRGTCPPTRRRATTCCCGSWARPDPRQIDGLGGAHPLTSKVAVVSPSDDPDADVDYLFLQLGVDQADRQRPAELRQHPRRGRARSRSSAASCPRADGETTGAHPDGQLRQRRRSPRFPTPGRTRWSTAATLEIAGVPGTAAPVVLDFADTAGSATGALLPTGHVRDTVEGIEVTCVDNGMPAVLLRAADLRRHRLRGARGAGGRRRAAGRLDADPPGRPPS